MNLIDKGTVAKRVGIGAAIGGAALSGLGMAGIGPLSGALGIGGGAAGAASAAGAGTAAGTAATTAGVGGAVAGAAKAAAPSVFSRMLGAAAPALGNAADVAAANRGTRAEMKLAAEFARQTGSREDSQARSDAQEAMLQSAYLASGPDRAKGPGVSPYSKPEGHEAEALVPGSADADGSLRTQCD